MQSIEHVLMAMWNPKQAQVQQVVLAFWLSRFVIVIAPLSSVTGETIEPLSGMLCETIDRKVVVTPSSNCR